MSEEKQMQDASVQEENAAQENKILQDMTADGNSVQMGGGSQKTPGKKSFSAGMKAVIALIAVLAVGIVGFASTKIYQAVKKANMDPTEYYKYVMKNERERSLKETVGYYGTLQKSVSADQANRELDMTVKISDTAKSMMALTGLDFSGLDALGINVVYGVKGDDVLASLALKANDEMLLSGNAAINAKEKKAYVQVPELSSSYLDFSKSFENIEEDTGNALLSLGKQTDVLPNGKELEEWVVGYSDIFIDSAENVEKKKEETVKIEDISEKATSYTFTLNNDKVIQMLEKLVRQLRQDKVLKRGLDAIDEEASSEFTKQLKELEEGLSKNLLQDTVGEVKVNVEAKISDEDRIVSQKISVENEGEEQISFYISNPKDGDKYGEELAVQLEGKDVFRLIGSGTNKSHVINGEYKLGMDSSMLEGSNLVNTDELLVIKLKDYDYSKLAKGEVKGTWTLSTSAVASLANCSLVIEQDGSFDSMKDKVKILLGKDTLMTLDVVSKGNAKLPDVKPSDGDKVYDAESSSDMVLYESELDIAGLLQKVEEKTGIDFSSLLDLAALGDEGYTDPGDVMDESDALPGVDLY